MFKTFEHLPFTILVNFSACADPKIFVREVQARRPENSLDNVSFFNLNLFDSLQRWFYYRENHTFPLLQRGSSISVVGGWGGGGWRSKC